MHKHKLIELQKIIEDKIGSLNEEVEIATNVKLNPLYIADRRDEIEFLQWIARTIRPILYYHNDEQQQLRSTKMRLELEDIIKFENILSERVQDLNLKLKDSKNLRESDILINEINTLESVLGHLSDLKYGDKARAIEIEIENHGRVKLGKYIDGSWTCNDCDSTASLNHDDSNSVHHEHIGVANKSDVSPNTPKADEANQ